MNSTDEPSASRVTQLTGTGLALARIGWIGLVAASLALLALSVVTRWTDILAAIPGSEAAILGTMNLPAGMYASALVAMEWIVALGYILAATGILLAKSDDRMAILVSSGLATFGATLFLSSVPATPDWLLILLRGYGISAMALALFLFPDGHFVPPVGRWIFLGFGAWLTAIAFFQPEEATNLDSWPAAARVLVEFLGWIWKVQIDNPLLQRVNGIIVGAILVTVLVGWFGLGVIIQMMRYTRHATPVVRQQTKAVLYGISLAVGAALLYYLPPVFLPTLSAPGIAHLVYQAASKLLFCVLLLSVPIFLVRALMLYRLWDVDLLINRTAVYLALTGLLGAVYIISVYLFQSIVRALTGQSSDIVIVLATLLLAALVRPLRDRLQNFIDRQFYREKVDVRRAFAEFGHAVRTQIDLEELQLFLVRRVIDLLHIRYGAVFLREPDGSFVITAKAGAVPQDELRLPSRADVLAKIAAGGIAYKPSIAPFPMLLPLLAPHSGGNDWVGVLALGPRLSGEQFSREDQSLLLGLADQAGTALRVAQLIEEQRAEVEERTKMEQEIAAHRDSPMGQAETIALRLRQAPALAAEECYRLADRAGEDLSIATLLDNLPHAFANIGESELAHLAEGFYYLSVSHTSPELLSVGLRALADQPAVGEWYSACQGALAAQSITEIASWRSPAASAESQVRFLAGLQRMMAEMESAADSLRAYERVGDARDRLNYLATAIERLGQLHHTSRIELGAADRPILRRITEQWIAVVTGAMGELQSRAQISCELITRHAWQSDPVTIVLALHNTGRAAAIGVEVELVSTLDFAVSEPCARVERLGPGDEAHMEYRLHPLSQEAQSRYRLEFAFRYTDSRGRIQTESFADTLQWMEEPAAFQYLPSPYVVGTPLQTGSPLFFGRDDVFAFIRENLEAAHRNNLVLIGQRRTGKSSLLKQLPARLEKDFFLVYLDGQALGLDPGLPAFFHAIATEIACALNEQGIPFAAPKAEAYAQTPAAVFEKDFLAHVRQALGARPLVILLDEFEELEAAARRGTLEPSIFNFLRHLIQHSPAFSVIFCGTHRLEELAADYWSALFNISLYRHVGLLSHEESMRLVQEPVFGAGIRYDDLALDAIWRATSGHPYFLQLLCHALITLRNRAQRNYITVGDVNAALEDLLTTGEAHFRYLWAESTPAQKQALFALSRMDTAGKVTPADTAKFLVERGIAAGQRTIAEACRTLSARDIFQEALRPEPVYAWKLGLLGRWVEKSKSLSQVAEETSSPIQ
jgi:hypothetical protein